MLRKQRRCFEEKCWFDFQIIWYWRKMLECWWASHQDPLDRHQLNGLEWGQFKSIVSRGSFFLSYLPCSMVLIGLFSLPTCKHRSAQQQHNLSAKHLQRHHDDDKTFDLPLIPVYVSSQVDINASYLRRTFSRSRLKLHRPALFPPYST